MTLYQKEREIHGASDVLGDTLEKLKYNVLIKHAIGKWSEKMMRIDLKAKGKVSV